MLVYQLKPSRNNCSFHYQSTAQFLFAAKIHQKNKHISLVTDALRTILSCVKHLVHYCNICFLMDCPKITPITQMSKKMGTKHITAAPELKTVPPTSETFKENVLRAHFQVAVWKSAPEPDPHPWTPQNMDGYVMKPQRLLHPEHSHQMLLLHHLNLKF